MIVNSIDLKEKYKGSIIWLNQTIKPRTVITYVDWLDSALDPIKHRSNKCTDFEIYIDMLVKGKTKEECELLMSELLATFDSGSISLDDMNFIYDFDFKNENRELVNKWLYHYKVTLTAYNKKGPAREVGFSGTEINIEVAGTADTPAVILLSSVIGLNSITIRGLTEDDIIINQVQAGSSIKIDGETCEITEDGENIFGKCELWEFPMLKPGIVAITLSSSCVGTLKYSPRYK